jgi:hypothetical protein
MMRPLRAYLLSARSLAMTLLQRSTQALQM